MEDITTKILKILQDEKIEPDQMTLILSRVAEDIQFRLWEKINVSLPLFYNLKDTIWFNLEHIPLEGETKGLSDLKHLGSKFPTLAYSINDSEYIQYDKVESLLNELGEILSNWSNDWLLVQLFTKSQEGWNGGKENPSPVIIYDPNTESPTKYGYKPYSSKPVIIDSKGGRIQSQQQEPVYCAIEQKLGTYGKEPLMRQLLERLIETCKKAIENQKGIVFDFNEYDYN